jgi:hypothetical protein
MDAGITHVTRANALEAERTWRVTGTALHWVDAHGAQQMDFSDMASIRLMHAPSRANRAQYLCQITTTRGRSQVIPSTHYAGILDFEDRADSYLIAVTALLNGVASANPNCAVYGGTSWGRYLGNIAAVAVSVVFLVIVLLLTGVPLLGVAVAKLVLIAMFLPAMLRWFAVNRPKRIDVGKDLAAAAPYLPAYSKRSGT